MATVYGVTQTMYQRILLASFCMFACQLGFVRLASGAESPEEACREMQSLCWSNPELFVERMHPEALKLFRQLIGEVVQATPADQRAVLIGQLFDGITSTDQIEQLSDPQLFVAFYRKLISSLPPDLLEQMRKAEQTPLGHVEEGDVAHVVLRTRFGGTDYRKLDVVSLKRFQDRWLGLMNEDVELKLRSVIQRSKEANAKRQQSTAQPFQQGSPEDQPASSSLEKK